MIKKLYNESISDGKLNATLFADKVMLHCRGIAARQHAEAILKAMSDDN